MTRRKGLIAKLLTPKKKKRKKSAARTQSRSQNNGWRYTSNTSDIQRPPIPDVEPFEVPQGPRDLTVYVYDGRPLKGTRKGSEFLLDVVRGRQTMKSVYTKTRWASTHAVAYEGQLIGFTTEGMYADLVKSLLKRYERVTVHAKRHGTDPGGWPIIKVSLPYKSWFDDEPERAKQRVALLWRLKALCNQKSRYEYEVRLIQLDKAE